MPVTLEEIDHARWTADAQANVDLSRIYQDAPPDRLPLAVEDFVRAHLESGGVFCCALFNDRLLGAVRVYKEPGAWWLSHFCVRKTTRRRGVGSRLLALVAETAREGNSALRVEASHLQMEDQLLLARLGYRLEVSGSYFELNPLASGGCQ
ncbi:Ribosomal protein S18 acetylase RimI [Modicisalibacter muralis]|uniref:Ribosomal protein S18 acetylase RimI n=1 Tax=Modicisalibacter muralis TaxID=119000 RepID=A0A1G9QE60_9GAMM|nr:acetyl-CoA sensor PanZ family protein [Halomonas muralis]SDM09374.1 Ribosomal protein S18 acetylase RimI [Halomonas muralis]